MIKRISTVVCFMIGYTYLVIGQPSTPSAAVYNYAQYAETPPNLYTGAISESIPVGAVTAGPLSHNVGINYYFAGHRPSEISSCVGLGFQLQAGGAITRQVLGLDDFGDGGWRFRGAQINDGLSSDERTDIVDGELDSQADVYTLHVGGLNIKFAMDHLGMLHTIPRSDLKITYHQETYLRLVPGEGTTLQPYNFFLLKDTQGNRYYFGEDAGTLTTAPVSNIEVTSFGDEDYNSIWYLYRIEDHEQAHALDFIYENHDYQFHTLVDCEELRYQYDDDIDRLGPECQMTAPEVAIDGKVIKKIVGLANEINFNYEEDRQDLLGSGKRLSSIDVKTGSFTKTLTLQNSSYFSDIDVSFNDVNDIDELDLDFTAFSAMTKKLRLNEIEISGGTESIPNYSFDYYRPNGSTTGSYLAYSSVNKAIDHYGFANGKFSNNDEKHIIPRTTIETNNQIISFGHPGGIRDSDPNYALTTGLYQMKLPTGGVITYNYEGNEIYDDRQFIKTKLMFSQIQGVCTSNNFAVNSQTVSFTQDQIDFGFIDWTLDNLCTNPVPAVIKIEVFRNGIFVHNSTFTTTQNNSGTINLNNLQNPIQPDVDYEIRLSVLRGNAVVAVRYTEDGTNTITGGMRLASKTTSDADAATDNDIVRTYIYEDNLNRSSGRIYRNPVYAFPVLAPPPLDTDYGNALFSTTSIKPFTSFEGHFMGYEQATIETNGNGSAVTKYFTDPNIEPEITFPPIPEQVSRSLWGQMRQSTIFPEGSTTPLQQTNYTINSTEHSFEINSTMYALRRITSRSQPGGTFSQTYTNSYKINTGLFRPSLTEEILEGLSKETEYTYDSQNHLLATSTSEKFPNGEEYKHNFTYTVDSPTSGAALDSLVARNIITLLIDEYCMNDKDVNRMETVYALWSSGLHPRPFILNRDYFDESGSSVREVDRNEAYNNRGLLTRFKQHGYIIDAVTGYDDNSLVTSSGMDGLNQSYAYHPGSNLMSEMTAIDGTKTTYDYDGMMRLESITDPVGATTTYEYNIDQNIGSHLSHIKTTRNFPADPLGFSELNSLIDISYLDGLGRTVQSVAVDQAYDGSSIINAVSYDNQGRSDMSYEPYSAAGSSFNSSFSTQPFTQTLYEPSPLNRPSQVIPPSFGTTSYTYGLNTTTLTDVHDSDVLPNSLFQRTVVDGNGNKSQSFTDIQGRRIITRRTNSDESLVNETKVDHEFRNLESHIVPPGSTLASNVLNYEYTYDREGKVIHKKVPSKEIINIVYDSRDLQIGFQDSYMRSQDMPWVGSQYDEFGRPISSGFYTNQPTNGSSAPNLLLTETTYGTNASLNVRNRGKVTNYKTRLLGSNDFIDTDHNYDQFGRPLTTVSNNVLQIDPSNKMNEVLYSYDGASNVVRTFNKYVDHEGIATEINNDSKLDTDGRSVSQWIELKDVLPQTQLCEDTYNSKNLMAIKFQGGNSSSYLQQINYNYLDNQSLHQVNGGRAGTDDLFGYQLNYNNNFAGWNPGTDQHNGNIKSTAWQNAGEDIYVQSYGYDYLDRLTAVNTGTKTTQSSTSPGQVDFNASDYEYDDRGNFISLSRKRADVLIDDLTYTPISENANQVRLITEAEDIEHGYKAVNEDSYVYDGNGNMIRDPQKGITISYNHLDLSDTIRWDDGRSLVMLYDADGNLHRRILRDASDENIKQYDFLGQIEYLDSLRYSINHSEGRIVNQGIQQYLKYLYLDHQQRFDGLFEAQHIESTGDIVLDSTGYEASQCIVLNEGFDVEFGAIFDARIEQPPTYQEDWQFEWNITDHLGNLRIVYQDTDGDRNIDPSTEIIQDLDYYPYGMRRESADKSALFNRFQFNGIDHVNEYGLDWNMATFRSLQPDIGLWGQADPKSESLKGMSPYCAMGNNPISNLDPDGDLPFLAVVGIGAAVGVFGNGISNAQQGQGFFDGAGNAAIWGGIGAAASFGIGAAAGGIFGQGASFGKAAFQFGAHGLSNGLQSHLQGGSFGQGFLSGGIGSGISSGIHASGGGTEAQIFGGGIGSAISGGNFSDGFTQGLIVGGFNHALNHGALAIRRSIARNAHRHLGSTEWNYDVEKDNFASGTNKCNKFCFDVLVESGADPGTPNGNRLGRLFGGDGTSPPTAGQWADPRYSIPGWKVVSSPRPGDVAAYAHNYSDATGHVAIVGRMVRGTGYSIGTSGRFNMISRSSFGFHSSHLPSGSNYVYRRYIGK